MTVRAVLQRFKPPIEFLISALLGSRQLLQFFLKLSMALLNLLLALFQFPDQLHADLHECRNTFNMAINPRGALTAARLSSMNCIVRS
jgi:hypothetical protein